ncbi:hypothetical protein Cgig2_021595 [Carnegiea gigantea]|uniref:MULE transposase domain-containing protein n=1 Tax=Carnegiea gigantea TaxID=171969 RepID=A0A9Q1GJI0_9CARY|nr:hypothetical protein Cgig2_021595 [Carnegiea gigantea]
MVCLDLSALNLTKLVDFDVNKLAKEPEPHVDELANYVGEVQGERGNNEGDVMNDDDNEVADFNEDEREIIHVECDRNLVVKKMTRVFNKNVLWSRNRYESSLRRAMRKIREIIRGKHVEGYRMLAYYVEQFKVKNPGSTCVINWIDEAPEKKPTFKHLFIGIGTAISLFKEHCRPIIRIDAYHLKGLYKGALMIAVSLDGNNGQFSLAYAVVEKENHQEWSFFLDGLVRALDVVKNQSRFTILSDRHKSTRARFKFDQTLKCSDNTNNFIKSFNHVILNFRVENYRKVYDTIVHPISTPTIWESITLPELDAQYSQVKKGTPEEHKRRDSQPLSPAIVTTSFGFGTTR